MENLVEIIMLELWKKNFLRKRSSENHYHDIYYTQIPERL